MSGFMLGMGQTLVQGGEVEANLERAETMIGQAAESGCDVVLLPECLDVGWTFPEAPQLAQTIPGSCSDRLGDAAQKYGVYVVGGLTERAGDRVYNTAVLISPSGEILLKHRKINILTIAQDIYSIGNTLGVAETPLGMIGVDICADNFPNSAVLGHALGRMGAQVILSPCAWAVDADHDNVKEPYGGMWRESYSELAKSYDMAVVGVSNVGWITGGVWEGRKCIGCSLAVGADGEVLAEGEYGEDAEQLTVVSVNLVDRESKG
ncbi:MAG: carbon-nitrogen hydrolase family protein, partial [Candidatus Latescibacteria bacterium]|nr:carbon-nitrogen hydrolase family protein [Candidatus Latescibacterota bacterium]